LKEQRPLLSINQNYDAREKLCPVSAFGKIAASESFQATVTVN
jgi:hypothetical protein